VGRDGNQRGQIGYGDKRNATSLVGRWFFFFFFFFKVAPVSVQMILPYIRHIII